MTTSSPCRPATAPVLAVLAVALLAPPAQAQQVPGQPVLAPGQPVLAVDQPTRTSLPVPVGIDEIRRSTSARRVPAMPGDPTEAGGIRTPLQSGLPDTGDRRGPEQMEEELVRTSLLNRFGGLGFSALGRLTRDGDVYLAEVMTRDRRWIEIAIDARTGDILPSR